MRVFIIWHSKKLFEKGSYGTGFYQKNIIIILPINQEWGHYLEISDCGLDILNERYQDQYIKASVWDFPVMTKRKRLISYFIIIMAFLLWTWAYYQ